MYPRKIGMSDWTISGLNFEFLLSLVVHVDGDLWTTQEWGFWEVEDIHRHTILE
jgi:hypothetical protein